jgi:hypothetical protein
MFESPVYTPFRIYEEMDVAFDQMGCIRPVYEEEPHESFRCPVCGAVNDFPGACSRECYEVYTAPPEDPREVEAWARDDEARAEAEASLEKDWDRALEYRDAMAARREDDDLPF